MLFVPNDLEYNTLMIALDGEQALQLRSASRELRARAADLVAGSRRLRRQCGELSRRTARVLRTGNTQAGRT